ncbi:MAG: STAS domain-containing protein [Ginsengibacter sp.]
MKVKIDTKEKMHVITIEEENLHANMTEEIKNALLNVLSGPIKNLVVNLKNVKEVDLSVGEAFVLAQQSFIEAKHSLVFCDIQPRVFDFLDKNDLIDVMNVTPTESEASDIVQMEEIEREFM